MRGEKFQIVGGRVRSVPVSHRRNDVSPWL